jgi:ABC-type uncharacterized transport system ATPase subunit
LRTSDATEAGLAKEMVGREVIFRLERVEVERGKPVLEVRDLSALNDKDLPALKGVSFTVHEGEILGIAGVSGNGQEVLAEVLAGLRQPSSGSVMLDSVDLTGATSLERWKKGMGYIPSDRNGVGSIGDYSLTENVLLNYYSTTPSPREVVDSAGTRSHRRIDRRVRRRHTWPRQHGPQPVGRNLQKLILASASPATADHRQLAHPGA